MLGHGEGDLVAGAVLDQRRDHLGDHITRALDDHPVADAQILAGDVVLVVQGRPTDGHAADGDRIHHGVGHQGAGAADVDADLTQVRGRGRRRKLVRHRPARGACHGAGGGLGGELVELDHRAVDIEIQLGPLVLPPRAGRGRRLDAGMQRDVLVDRKARLAQPAEQLHLGRRGKALGGADAVRPQRQRPLGGDPGVDLAQAPGRRIPGVGKGR